MQSIRILKSACLITATMLLVTACEQASDEVANSSALPKDQNILFWSTAERDAAFRQMEDLLPFRTISAGDNPYQFKQGNSLKIDLTIDDDEWSIDNYMRDQRASALIIIHNDQIRLEEYKMDYKASQRWTSFSVAKSFTSTLVGAAIQDGFIKSIDDQLTTYIPELIGSGYDGVTVEQLLTMQSGVAWNEDYSDPQSDVAQFLLTESVDGIDPIIIYMKTLEREVEPGTRWQYNTGETNLIGVLVTKATGKTLSDYLTEKVWKPFGMEMDAIWLLNTGAAEIGGCCMSIKLRDYARFGLFALNGGVINGKPVVPDDWFASAGTKQVGIGVPGFGYGYQWWTYDDGSYAAQGIFGQGIFIDPKRNLVIVGNGNWLEASNLTMKERRNAFYFAVQAAIDKES